MYDVGAGRVLRRYRSHDVPRREVIAMEHARRHGYPVPEVYGVSGRDMITARIDAPTMLELLEGDLTVLDDHATILAGLHERLHTIEAPPGLPAIGHGEALLHLDLHPRNVLLGADGPWVIDWTNAGRGHWADDVAQTVAIIWSARTDERLGGIVERFVEVFLRAFDRAAVRAHLDAAIERRVTDVNVTDAERAAIRGLRL